jgi:hypothetical protein
MIDLDRIVERHLGQHRKDAFPSQCLVAERTGRCSSEIARTVMSNTDIVNEPLSRWAAGGSGSTSLGDGYCPNDLRNLLYLCIDVPWCSGDFMVTMVMGIIKHVLQADTGKVHLSIVRSPGSFRSLSDLFSPQFEP